MSLKTECTWPDTRGWISIGLYIMTLFIIWITKPINGNEPSEFFKTMCTALVVTGFVNMVLAFHFTSTKEGVDKNATISNQAQALVAAGTTAQTVADTAATVAQTAAGNTQGTTQTTVVAPEDTTLKVVSDDPKDPQA